MEWASEETWSQKGGWQPEECHLRMGGALRACTRTCTHTLGTHTNYIKLKLASYAPKPWVAKPEATILGIV